MKFKKFTNKDRGTFRYQFWHWLAFNHIAIKYKVWKFKYLFHDVDKIFLMLYYHHDYELVREYHKTHNRHHLKYRGNKDYDYVGMVIDWECSHLTKSEKPLDFIGTLRKKLTEDSIDRGVAKKLLYTGYEIRLYSDIDLLNLLYEFNYQIYYTIS